MTKDEFPLLWAYVEDRIGEFELIPDKRKELLFQLACEIRKEVDAHQSVNLVFICTHNSRRSHMSHLWAQMASGFYEIEEVRCFSGGTESTAFNPRAVKALQDAGMRIEKQDDSANPLYHVRFPGSGEGISTFSKRVAEPPNPTKNFVAVMTCSDADEACPMVPGAAARYSITFEDPKVFDNTPEETVRYDEKCAQIAREMFFLFSRV